MEPTDKALSGEPPSSAAIAGAPPAPRKGDLTQGPIARGLLVFTLPMLGANLLQSLNGTANAAWVSHILGPAALTATANANNILFLLLGAVFGLAMAANLLIAQAVGAGSTAEIKRVAGASTLFFALLSLAVGLAGLALTPAILAAMGTPADARADAITYLRVIFAALPFMYFFSFAMMAMRGTGDSRTPFYFSLAAVGLDIVLNPVLILGLGPAPTLGIGGSAAATLISQTIALAGMIVFLYRTGSPLVLRRGEWGLLRPDPAILKTLVFKGLPMAMHMLVVSGAAVVMLAFVNAYGSQTAAAYAAAMQVWTYVQMPAMALGAAVSSMAAQNVGAGRMDRVEAVARTGVLFAIIMTALPIALIYLAEPLILRIFLPEGSGTIPIARHINAIVLWGFVPFGVAFIFAGVVRATGAVIAPLLAMVVSLWVVRIPFAQLLTPMLGADAIWWSFPLGSVTTMVLAGGYYVWGGWRRSTLSPPPRGDVPGPALAPATGSD
ncbi:MAG: MATE family efflux transporter [Phenylobacterium sp.]|uniref:MATE family efflux transporter n=1 Tax=Phenylobacterium sp. TaxID=1871053 RepID=UPI00271B9F21|nr:MATE family efflux transporter [Phenylobacterium sp.]MDO8902592.1 MATE family efflux transporter [Phenylobacterium sp.]